MAPDSVSEFRTAMAAAGLTSPDPIVADGKLHRVHIEGDRKGVRNGWYVLHDDDHPAGRFGSWKAGVQGTWHAASNGTDLSPAEREQRARESEHLRRARATAEVERQQHAAERSRRLWDRAKPVNAAHPYLARKSIGAHGVRQLGNSLVVPLYNGVGALKGLQFIDTTGDKRFIGGTAKRGAYYPIGTPTGVLVIAEGFATAATIHEATGHAVAVAFDAGNLQPVAQALREKLPDVRIVIAADNDCATEGNPGLTKATAAARTVGAVLAVPTFATDDAGTDWNDLAQHDGLPAVRAAFGAVCLTTPAPQTVEENRRPDDEPGPPRRSAPRPLGEWLSQPELLIPPTAYIERFAYAGRATLIVAREKLGKSTLTGQGVTAAVNGAPFLDVATPPTTVLWYAQDEALVVWRIKC